MTWATFGDTNGGMTPMDIFSTVGAIIIAVIVLLWLVYSIRRIISSKKDGSIY